MTPEVEAIQIGDFVRSYDFAKDRDCYVEGVVYGVAAMGDCERYVIRVTGDVFQGKPVAKGLGNRVGLVVTPPVNGTPKSLGGVCDLVVKINREF